MAGDEQDDNSKVGKIVIYHINFAEQQGIKKHISLFCTSPLDMDIEQLDS